MRTVCHGAQKYLHPFGSRQLPFEYAHKIAQKTGSNYHLVAGIQWGRIAYDAVLVHTSTNLRDQFIANWRWNSAETDNIGYAAREVDVVEHLQACKATKYISWKQLRIAPAVTPL